MDIQNTNIRGIDRKVAEYLKAARFGNTTAGGFFVSDKSNMIPSNDIAYYVAGASSIWDYNADQDGWLQLPNSGVAGTFAAGSCGEFRALSAMGGLFTNTALAGGTTTLLKTDKTIVRDLEGCEIRIVAGAGRGFSGTIKAVKLGANAEITVNGAGAAVAFDATTKYQIYGGSLWIFNAGTVAVGFAVYDRATNAWTQKSVTGLPTAWGTDAQLVSTGGKASNNGNGFVTGSAIAGATTTTLPTSLNLPANANFKNQQVRLNGGLGNGQIRKIVSHTTGVNAVITVDAAWDAASTPDATTTFVIEGNDDVFYLGGNNAVTVYKHTVSTNTWVTIAPVAARAGAMATGASLDWIDAAPDADWNDGTYGYHYSNTIVKQNGRYLVSFRGGATNVLDFFDTAVETWVSGVAYGQQTEVFGAGSCSVDTNGIIYIQKDATGVIFRFNVAKNVLEPFFVNPSPQGAVLVGDKMIIQTFKVGTGKLEYVYTLGHTRAELTRVMVV